MGLKVGIITIVWVVGGMLWAGNLAQTADLRKADNPAGWKMVGGKGQLESTGSYRKRNQRNGDGTG